MPENTSGLQYRRGVASIVSIIDEVSENLIYLGSAFPKTEEDSPNWQIRKIETEGTITRVLWAEGTVEHEFKWSDRLTLNYF